MQQLVSLLRKCLSAAGSTCGVKLPQLSRQRGVEDFLIDTDSKNMSAPDIAVLALTELCEGSDIADFVIATAVVAFLDKAIGCPKEDRLRGGQRERDLLQLVRDDVRTEQSYRQWFDSWYS